MKNWISTTLRLEVPQLDQPSDLDERVRHAVAAMRVDGWFAVGAIESVATGGLYLVFERESE